MPIPDFDEATGALPPGEHLATLEEVRERYATNFRRREVFQGLTHVVDLLTGNGVTVIWVDGSFVASKVRPSDVDVIYEKPSGINLGQKWWLSQRDHLKKYHRVDLWLYPSPQPLPWPSNQHITIKQFFEKDLDDTPKGIIQLDLGVTG